MFALYIAFISFPSSVEARSLWEILFIPLRDLKTLLAIFSNAFYDCCNFFAVYMVVVLTE